MIKGILGFSALWFMLCFGLFMWNNSSSQEKWSFLKVAIIGLSLAIVASLLAVGFIWAF